MAWLSARWPRTSGILLLAVAVAAFFLLFRGGDMSQMTDSVAHIFVLGPLLASGIALLCAEIDDDRAEEAMLPT